MSTIIVNYEILIEQDPTVLARKVRSSIEKGWEPFQGMIYGKYGNGVEFWAQPIVMRRDVK